MFFAGAALAKAVFYFQEKQKQKQYYVMYVAVALQALQNLFLSHKANLEVFEDRLKQNSTDAELDLEKYLENEGEKIAVFMEIYTMLLIRAVPKEARKFINFSNWTQAKALINKLRGPMDGEDNG
jgi:hypothetical protein